MSARGTNAVAVAVVAAVVLLLSLISEPRQTIGISPDPKGGAHGCAPFFDRARMASRKIPAPMNQLVCLVGESLSLVTFFGSAKKVTRRQAKAFALKAMTSKGQRLPPSAGSFLLISVKRNEPKKNAFPTRQTREVVVAGIFRLAIHGEVEKRRTSMCGALRVW